MFDDPVTLTPDDNGTVLMTFADVPEAITFGTDEDEALLNAIDALETGLSFYLVPCTLMHASHYLLSASPKKAKKPFARQPLSAPSSACTSP